MDYEKEYKRALERATELNNRENASILLLGKGLEYIFPELKESEDERIRKEILSYVKSSGAVTNKQWIAWLEKQKISEVTTKSVDKMVAEFADTKEECTNGKPVNCQIRSYKQGITDALRAFSLDGEKGKTEPKFHEGEWIVFNGLALYIKEVVKGYYRTISKGGIINSYDWDIDNVARLWTIQEAKDGDVLAVENMIFVYKIVLASHIVSYCKLFNNKFEHFSDARTCCEGNSKVRPATKEQRDLLFAKMKEAGYDWNAEKKELKKQ